MKPNPMLQYDFKDAEVRILASGVKEKAAQDFVERYAGRLKLNGTVSGRFSSTEPNFGSIPKGAPKKCTHGFGFNCRACFPTMPLPENNYRNRRLP